MVESGRQNTPHARWQRVRPKGFGGMTLCEDMASQAGLGRGRGEKETPKEGKPGTKKWGGPEGVGRPDGHSHSLAGGGPMDVAVPHVLGQD